MSVSRRIKPFKYNNLNLILREKMPVQNPGRPVRALWITFLYDPPGFLPQVCTHQLLRVLNRLL